MVMSWIFTGIVGISILFSILLGQGGELASAIPRGAQAGVTLVISMAGSVCLWCGVGKVMEKAGITGALTRILRPFLHRLFPETKTDPALANCLSANVCANFLGLGNAATPMGIQAAKQLAGHSQNGVANDALCRLVVLNTASIQLIPSTVAAIRASLGCPKPFDILPAVWVTSFCSAGTGLLAAWILGKLWHK